MPPLTITSFNLADDDRVGMGDLGDIEKPVRRADEERRKIIEIRDKPDYIKGQDVETV